MISVSRRRSSITAAVCALALIVPVAGCGGDDSNQFREDYNAAVSKLGKITGQIGSATAGGSPEKAAKQLDSIADAAADARADIAALEPPEDAKKQFDTLLAALNTGVKDLRSMAKAAKSNNPETIQTASQALTKSGAEITTAENALRTAVDG